MSILNAAHFKDEIAAYAFVEARVWPKGRICPHCGVVENSGALKGKSTRIGTYKCYSCRKPFTVKVGTIFEKSHIPMHTWLQAMFLLCSSKKGMSANQLHRILGVTLKSAWFMAHRIRKAMEGGFLGPLGGEGKVVEADETYLGKRGGKKSEPDLFISSFGWQEAPRIETQRKIVSVVERGGAARSFSVDSVDKKTVRKILFTHADRKSALMTDEHSVYPAVGAHFAAHQTVNHSQWEYARGPVSTNTVEGFFSIFKRGFKGIYQHCDRKHLDRYLGEYDFRYTNRIAVGIDDQGRTLKAIDGVRGKRLTYRELTQ